MSVINKILGLFLGNKYDKDIKEINPYVVLVHQEFEKLQGLTNDELRDKTSDLKVKILAGIAENQEEIKNLRENAEKEEDVYLKEEI
jgi:preprotein translocase subunit SecA